MVLKLVNIDTLSSHPFLSPTDYEISILQAGVYQPVSQSTQTWDLDDTIEAPNNPEPAVDLSVRFKPDEYYFNDVFSQTENISLSVEQETLFTEVVNVTCSLSGDVVVTHSLAQYNSISVPNWLSIDTDTGTLSGTTPLITENTTFTFYIESVFIGKARLIGVFCATISNLLQT